MSYDASTQNLAGRTWVDMKWHDTGAHKGYGLDPTMWNRTCLKLKAIYSWINAHIMNNLLLFSSKHDPLKDIDIKQIRNASVIE